MAAMGKVPASPGRCERMSESRATSAPITNTAGRSLRWSAVRNNMRDTWGTAKPIKEMGPQSAVTTAVSRPVNINNRVRTRFTFTPRLVA